MVCILTFHSQILFKPALENPCTFQEQGNRHFYGLLGNLFN